MGFRRSRFAVVTPADERSSRVHIYHTLYDHHLVVDQSPEETVDAFMKKIECGAALSETENQAAATLAQMGVLVSADADEIGAFESWYHNVLQGQSESMVAHITTTMACNMRCRYCMEHAQLNQSSFMDHETAMAAAAWLKRQIVRRNAKKLSLFFFGGEPLMNVPAIETISGDIKEFCKEEGVAFKAGAITNGTLLTREVSSILAKAGLSWIKVTLDGDKRHHDRMRVFAKGGGTFDTIWENLGYAAKDLRLCIGGNFPDGDMCAFDSLLEKLAVAPWRHAIADVRFKPIMKPGIGGRTAANRSCDHGAFTQEQVRMMLDMREKINRTGLPTINDPNVGPCDFYRNNIMTIGVGGEIYPCSGFVGISDFEIGSIRMDEPTEFGEQLKTLRSWCDNCKECSYLPVCAGGCRLPAYLSGRNVDATVCDKDFYEKIVPYMLSARANQDNAEAEPSGIFA